MAPKGTEKKKDVGDASNKITQRKTDEKAAHYSAVASDGSQNTREREASMLFSVAEEHIDEDEDYDEALKAAEDAMKIFKELGNTNGVADTIRLIVHASVWKAEDYRWTERGDAETNLCGQTMKTAEERAQGELDKFKEAGDKLGEACMRLSLAELCMHDRGPASAARREEALEHATVAEELFREAGDRKREADSMVQLASVHYNNWSADEAARLCEGALGIYRDLASRKDEAKTSHLLACALCVCDQFTACVAAAKESLKIFRELDLKNFIAFELVCIAGYYIEQRRGKDALPFAKEAVVVFKELDYGRGWQAGAAEVVVQAQLAKGDSKQALRLAKESVNHFEGSDDKRSQVSARCAHVKALMAKDQLSDALLETETALEEARELEDKILEASILSNVASIHICNKSHDQALSAGLEARQLMQDAGNKAEEAQCLDLLCDVHKTKKDFKMMLQTAEEQRDLYRELGDKYSEGRSLLTLADAQARGAKFDEALVSATEAQALFQEKNHKRGEGSAWNTISHIHQANGMLDLAQQATQKMQSLLEECDDKTLHASGLRSLTLLHLNRDEPDIALKHANEARAIAKKIGDRTFEVEMLILVSNAHVASLMKEITETKKEPSRAAYDKAMKAPKEAVLLAKKTGDKGCVACAQYALGEMYLTQSRPEDAQKVALDAGKNFKERGDDAGEIRCILLSAQTYAALQEFPKATELVNQALKAAKECGDFQGEHSAQQLMQAIQERQGGGQQRQQQVQQSAPEQGAQQAQSAAVVEQKASLDPVVVTKMVQDTLAASLGTDEEIHMDTPLMEAGMDSLSMVAFRNQLQRESGISMPASVMFDYPSMSGLVDHLVESSRG